jgi:hypothetical protein
VGEYCHNDAITTDHIDGWNSRFFVRATSSDFQEAAITKQAWVLISRHQDDLFENFLITNTSASISRSSAGCVEVPREGQYSSICALNAGRSRCAYTPCVRDNPKTAEIDETITTDCGQGSCKFTAAHQPSRFQKDRVFTFKMTWDDEGDQFNMWRQTTNSITGEDNQAVRMSDFQNGWQNLTSKPCVWESERWVCPTIKFFVSDPHGGCFDGAINGLEQGVDCGGTCATACPTTAATTDAARAAAEAATEAAQGSMAVFSKAEVDLVDAQAVAGEAEVKSAAAHDAYQVAHDATAQVTVQAQTTSGFLEAAAATQAAADAAFADMQATDVNMDTAHFEEAAAHTAVAAAATAAAAAAVFAADSQALARGFDRLLR